MAVTVPPPVGAQLSFGASSPRAQAQACPIQHRSAAAECTQVATPIKYLLQRYCRQPRSESASKKRPSASSGAALAGCGKPYLLMKSVSAPCDKTGFLPLVLSRLRGRLQRGEAGREDFFSSLLEARGASAQRTQTQPRVCPPGRSARRKLLEGPRHCRVTLRCTMRGCRRTV
jgi:hypothetical protein